MIKHDELKKLALAATPGPWETGFPNNTPKATIGIHAEEYIIADMCEDGYSEQQQEANAQYIAAANPAVVLELIQERNDLETKMREQFEVSSMAIAHMERENTELLKQIWAYDAEMFKRGLQAADDKLIELQGRNTELLESVRKLKLELELRSSAAARQGAEAVIESLAKHSEGKV